MRVIAIRAAVSAFFLGMCAARLSAQTVEATEFRLVDGSGRVTAQLSSTSEGSAALFVMDGAGRVRLNAGVYGDGMPFVVLNDEQGRAAGIFRLAGANQAPVVVFKQGGQDRVVLGPDYPGGWAPGGSSSSWIPAAVAGAMAGFLGGLATIAIRRRA